MFPAAYTQYQDLQLPSWNEFDCDDVEGDGTIPQENSNALNFEHQLINDLDKHVSGAGISHLANNTGSNQGASVSAPGSSGSSISSASSYNAQIFDSVDLLNLTSFPTKSSVDDESLMRGGMITSPASSCVSPTLTSVNSMEKNNYNISNLDYHIDPANNIPQYHSAFDTNYISIKQEDDDIQSPSQSINNVSPSSSITSGSNSSTTSGPGSALASASSLSTLVEEAETNNVPPPSSSSAASSGKKTKESKSGGRIKKPMTMVQRKAHNKIERKYRININSKIANLQKLVPWMSEDGVAFEIDSKSGKKVPLGCISNDDAMDDAQLAASASNKKLNKSMILDMVTEYLLLLKDECRKKDAEISELKTQLSESSVSYS